MKNYNESKNKVTETIKKLKLAIRHIYTIQSCFVTHYVNIVSAYKPDNAHD